MRGAWLVILLARAAVAQSPGQELFARTCGSAYCHGARGAGGGAPRLAGRGFDRTYIADTVSRGVPGTSMPAFGGSLSRDELEVVVEYAASLNGIPPKEAKPAQTASLSPEAAKGRDLFSDSLRGFERCSTCHEVNGIGIPVAPPITSVPPDAQALRTLQTPSVQTATLGNRAMPGLPVSNGSRAAIFYDLTAVPPVLRTAEPGTVSWANVASWRHSSVIMSYTDAELGAILSYLRWAEEP
jgi:mono/diheme cytochrome c family protein